MCTHFFFPDFVCFSVDVLPGWKKLIIAAGWKGLCNNPKNRPHILSTVWKKTCKTPHILLIYFCFSRKIEIPHVLFTSGILYTHSVQNRTHRLTSSCKFSGHFQHHPTTIHKPFYRTETSSVQTAETTTHQATVVIC